MRQPCTVASCGRRSDQNRLRWRCAVASRPSEAMGKTKRDRAKRKEAASPKPIVEKQGKEALVLSETARKRIEVCILIKHTRMGLAAACKKVGVDRYSFGKNDWYDTFLKGGIAALLKDKRHKTPKQMTPTSKGVALHHAKKGANANEIQARIRESRAPEDERPLAATAPETMESPK